MNLLDRYRGALVGLACGDAVGTTVEFAPRGSFPELTDMIGGGPFGLAPGQWTDDTSMALCLAESLVAKGGFDASDQMGRYLNWWRHGYLSSTGVCFDIGLTVRTALGHFERTGWAFAGSTDPFTAGNGSLMRLAPIVLFAYPDRSAILELSAASSRTTHGASEAVECCQLFGTLIGRALAGEPKGSLRCDAQLHLTEPKVRALAQGRYLGKDRSQIRGSGYCVDSLEAALWCFQSTANFRAAVLEAANLGDDADTTAAIVGQIAGAYYGASGIPDAWLEKLHAREHIEGMAESLCRLGESHDAT